LQFNKSNIKNESIKDMIINKKIYNEKVARQVFIFISNTNRVGLASLSSPAPTREIKNENR